MRALPLLILLAAFHAVAPAAGQTSAFAYDPARVPVGTTHEYVKSNLDGSHAIRVIARLSGPDRLEVLKLEPENGAAAWVVARMDWASASAESLTSAVLFPDGSRRPQAALSLDPAAHRVTVDVLGVRDTLTVPLLPVHVYNFDLLSLAATLPHLVNPHRPFVVGVMNPTFRSEPPVLSYDGEILIEPEVSGLSRGIGTRRYRITGEGMAGAEARLWVALDDGRLVAVESPVPDNPGWSSFRLELQSTTRMDDPEWEAFVAAEVAALAAPAVAAADSATPGLRYEFAPGDSAVAEMIAAYARAARARIEAFFERPFEEPVLVRVFPDRAAFDAYTTEAWGFATQCWMVGAGATRELLLLSPRAWAAEACDHDPDDPEELAELVAHELVHVYHMQRNPSNEFEGADEIGWFVEGLATYVSGQLDGGGHRARAREALAAGELPARLADAWSGPYRYGVSGTLVEYVDRLGGRPLLVTLLRATTQSEILDALGIDEPTLLEGWRAFLAAPE